ncbi:bacillithiol biosynthesis cysteine-adding enzyme BshC [Arcticibacter sp. MXS-1]|uniref:bacillithiol biosynthesis cysteine-adding enzyme BshC n=1 Tax=Arcticibacter sp. MXS-1 TaxID=3341726 RepID=UPI0035A98C7D
MKATYIDYSETNSFSSTALSYLSRDPKLRPFLFDYPSIEAFDERIRSKRQTPDRNVLSEVLKDQYLNTGIAESWSSEDPVCRNIALLKDPQTYTITTGHQLNIFTGPLYFIYKIVTAINLARQLKEAFPDNNFVPVYWMATEDHDFAEINHTSLHGKPLKWDFDAAGATGKLPTETIFSTVKEYRKLLGLSENSEKLGQLMESAYLEHKTLAGATRYLVHHLFGEYGLVVVDADSPALKQQFADIIEEDITSRNSFRLITETSKKIHELGYATQVNAREINFFYMKEGLRERIVEENGVYTVLGSDLRFSETELRDEIRQHPERFSPNVIMRPLYQEVILPNLAYIGGGAELVYWLQLKANFDHYKTDFPLLILRNSALITDETFGNKLCRLRISLKDFFKETAQLQKEWVLRHSKQTLSLADEQKEFKSLFEKIKLRAYKIDPTLGPSTEAVKARLEKALGNLEKKLIKAEKRNHEGALSQIENLRNKYFPGGGLQERSENFGLFYLKYGDELISELVRHFKPLDFKFTVLEP